MDDALWRSGVRLLCGHVLPPRPRALFESAFFQALAASMPESLMLKMARIGSRRRIAVAIFFVGDDALYGRYWGAGGNYHSLHFETCYYQGIEYCIEKKLQRFEPGTQGEHKVPRGFVPTLMSSAHYIVDPRFAAAIADYARARSAGRRSLRGGRQRACPLSSRRPMRNCGSEQAGLAGRARGPELVSAVGAGAARAARLAGGGRRFEPGTAAGRL